ncbi:MAG: glutamate--tRNA ligase [Candidatus Thermoplasmatota archaeon]|jgi:glutamyl-tRNA synthetase|nr:glutamate--tRNA ligase [Candidatus Thermoplasmatota archaeon]
MSTQRIQREARKYALQNAVLFNGKANEKAVTGKVIAALKKDGVSPGEIIPVVSQVVKQVNAMSPDDQLTELTNLAPELLHKEKKEKDFSLPALPCAEKGKVVTRFPPEPNGYLHIGHAKAAIIDSEYARLYDGKFILRFDDTNPENALLEFYDAQKEDLHWLGVEWDSEYHTSDNLQTHYKLAEQLIRQKDAYVCKCASEIIREGRFHGKPCACQEQYTGTTGLDLWKQMLASPENPWILRLHGEMNSENTAMRDPTLFRVITAKHPLTNEKYHVWPTYDFAGAVEDSISGVTHPFRTKEYELRDEVYFKILSLLHLRTPHLMEFSRLSIDGMPVSKRKIKPLIEQGLVLGFDDVRLPTLRGLKRRGIVPEAIKQFVLQQGFSKVESIVDFSLVESVNRKYLDPKVKRYYYVPDPVQLTVTDAPKKTMNIPLHPDATMGDRTIHTSSVFFIPKDDVQKMNIGDVFRLKGLYNVKITKKNETIQGSYQGESLIAETAKIQWTTQEFIPLKILVPGLIFTGENFNPESLKELQGYAEKAITDLPSGEIVQFERVGFVRLEKQPSGWVGFFAHK